MDRDIHDIYDVILKIIANVYGTLFLNYIGIEQEIKEILNVEFTTLTGNKLYLDFLCLLKDGTLCHIEFQYPRAEPNDLDRFFKYNVHAEVRYQSRAETFIFNFSQKIGIEKPRKIGKTKCFNPHNFYLGDVEFDKYIEKINIKAKSNTQVSNFEEITLMLISLNPEMDCKFETLKKISILLKNKELFDEGKYEFIQAVIELEINNLLTNEEQNKIKEEMKMTPKAMAVVTRAINEVNQKVLAETRDDAHAEGRAEGRAEGIKEMAKALRGQVDLDKLSEITGLSVDEIERL